LTNKEGETIIQDEEQREMTFFQEKKTFSPFPFFPNNDVEEIKEYDARECLLLIENEIGEKAVLLETKEGFKVDPKVDDDVRVVARF
jgi:hypothetical protein